MIKPALAAFAVAATAAALAPAGDAEANHRPHHPKEKCSYGWMKQCTPIARRMDCRWIRYKGCTTIPS